MPPSLVGSGGSCHTPERCVLPAFSGQGHSSHTRCMRPRPTVGGRAPAASQSGKHALGPHIPLIEFFEIQKRYPGVRGAPLWRTAGAPPPTGARGGYSALARPKLPPPPWAGDAHAALACHRCTPAHRGHSLLCCVAPGARDVRAAMARAEAPLPIGGRGRAPLWRAA